WRSNTVERKHKEAKHLREKYAVMSISIGIPRMNAAQHVTVKKRGQKLYPHRWHADANLFTCPFCSSDACKPRPYHLIMAHLAGHRIRMLEYGDLVIYTCKLGCGMQAKHFHCCYCPKRYVNRNELMKHLNSTHPIIKTQAPSIPIQPGKKDASEELPSTIGCSSKYWLLLPAPPMMHRNGIYSQFQPKKVAGPPRKLLAPPEENQEDGRPYQGHITVKKKDQKLFPNRWPADPALFTCPFCSLDACKPRPYHLIMTHLAGHKLRVLEYADQVIYTCKLDCGKKPKHHHCCSCPKSFGNPRELMKHLLSDHPISTCAQETQDQPLPQNPAKEGLSPAESSQEDRSLQLAGPLGTQEGAVKVPLPSKNLKKHIERKHQTVLHSVSTLNEPEPSSPSSCPCAISPVSNPDLEVTIESPVPNPMEKHKADAKKRAPVMCPHCNLCLRSNNLKKHIERKHQTPTDPVSTVLSAQCVDKANGIYVVGKAIGDNSPPIHVAKKFWGSTHRIMCELDVCNSRVEKAQKNELLARQCLHLNAVDFCQEVAPNEELSEVVLNYLVDHKGVDPSMKSQCLEQQNKAKSEGVTLASVVTLNECSNTYFISVFEPEVSHFCKMGRVLVCYDANDKKWACPCKVRKSCLHKNIAQWCLFQMKRELFITKDQQEVELRVETAGEDLDLSNIL
ncbi:hypothetical protein DNTS_018853, partial [Danionella cerebrum]